MSPTASRPITIASTTGWAGPDVTAPFSPATAAFLTDLAKHNDRGWFTVHRAEYDTHVRDPLQSLLDEVTVDYGPGRVMRPNRDVRFSADKTPYRTTASMWAGTVGGVYLQVDAGGLEAGGGLYEPTRDQLQRAREAIDTRPVAASRLRTIIETLDRAGFSVAGPSLATAPRGFARDHPEIELLRLKHYAALRRLPLSSSTADIRDAWRTVEPLIEWSGDYVGPALAWP